MTEQEELLLTPAQTTGSYGCTLETEPVMAENEIKLSEEVLALLKKRAEADGVSLEEAATQAVKIGLEEGRWRALLASGRRYGRQSGYTEGDVQDLVRNFRKENRGR